MNSTTTGKLRNPNIDLRARYAFNISRVLTGVFVISVGLYLFLAQSTNSSQLYTISVLSALVSILNIMAIRYSRQKKVETAVFLIIAGIFLFIPITTFLLSGIGLLLGIVGFVSIFMISTLTLVQPHLSRVVISGTVMSVGTILLEVFYPAGRLEVREIGIFIPVISSIAIAIFGYYIYQQFANYPLRIKLILLFIIVVFFSVGPVALVTNTLIRNEITQQVGLRQQTLAERFAFETGKDLEAQVEKLQAVGTQFEKIAAELSLSYTGSDNEIIDQLIELDQAWKTGPDDSNLLQSVLDNQTASELRDFREIFPSHVELFLTDKYGANIAATNKSIDYYHADKGWWRQAYDQGNGKIYIGQPEFFGSSQTYGVLIAIPIYAEEEVVGVLRSIYNISAIFENLEQGAATGTGTQEFDLRFANDALLNPEEIPGLTTVIGGYGEIQYKGEPSLVSQQRVFASENSNASEAVSELGWSMIVHEDVVNALQPVQEQTRAITLIALVVTALVGVMGFFASQRLAAPILTLTEITRKIEEG
ncbi:MAG: PDC sensor domain-containing protein, partial [Anaerolineales bacterium]|nr:PDC sensor domain-containing protein [Anaerolineales bacterium]